MRRCARGEQEAREQHRRANDDDRDHRRNDRGSPQLVGVPQQEERRDRRDGPHEDSAEIDQQSDTSS
jgi:hypothetical protein